MNQNSPTPTPGQVLDQIVEQFGPKQDDTLPFTDQAKAAKRRLATMMFTETFGENSSISRFVQAYSTFDRVLESTDEGYFMLLTQLRTAYEEIQTDVKNEISDEYLEDQGW